MRTPKVVEDAGSRMTNVSRIYGRREMEQAFLEAFERSGGVDRLVAWASQNKNYKDFLQLLIKFAPKEMVQEQGGMIIEYRSMVPGSPLNKPKKPPVTRGALNAPQNDADGGTTQDADISEGELVDD
jgi:hypothetical protein